MRADADATFVQRLDRDLVALAHGPQHVATRHAAAVQQQLAGPARAQSQLVFLLADGKSRELTLDDERRDAAVAGARVNGGKHDEQVSLVGVRNPQLAAAEDEVVAILHGPCLEGKRVAAGSSPQTAQMRRRGWLRAAAGSVV